MRMVVKRVVEVTVVVVTSGSVEGAVAMSSSTSMAPRGSSSLLASWVRQGRLGLSLRRGFADLRVDSKTARSLEASGWERLGLERRRNAGQRGAEAEGLEVECRKFKAKRPVLGVLRKRRRTGHETPYLRYSRIPNRHSRSGSKLPPRRCRCSLLLSLRNGVYGWALAEMLDVCCWSADSGWWSRRETSFGPGLLGTGASCLCDCGRSRLPRS